VYESDPVLDSLIPDDPRQPYDARSIILRVVDDGDFLEVHEHFAPNIVVGFARVQGRTVGVVANQPMVMSGALDINASVKAARFIRFCNAFNIPLLNFVDVPGFMPGVKQEYGGIIRHGAKMLFAYAAATVPKITLVTRKAYGGSFLAMCAKSMGADRVFAWPTAEIGVMGAEGAVQIIYGREIAASADPAALKADRIEEYRERFASPYLAAARMHIDNVIEPRDTREYVSFALETLRNKRELRPPKKHGTMPL
jgi:methylmalonyl-CoA carboxyltransferase large subunit